MTSQAAFIWSTLLLKKHIDTVSDFTQSFKKLKMVYFNTFYCI